MSEDVRALRKILFESTVSLSRKNIVENSSVTSVSHAVQNMLNLDGRHKLLQTFTEKLFNASDTGTIKDRWHKTSLTVVSLTTIFTSFTQHFAKGHW